MPRIVPFCANPTYVPPRSRWTQIQIKLVDVALVELVVDIDFVGECVAKLTKHAEILAESLHTTVPTSHPRYSFRATLVTTPRTTKQTQRRGTFRGAICYECGEPSFLIRPIITLRTKKSRRSWASACNLSLSSFCVAVCTHARCATKPTANAYQRKSSVYTSFFFLLSVSPINVNINQSNTIKKTPSTQKKRKHLHRERKKRSQASTQSESSVEVISLPWKNVTSLRKQQ